MIKFIISYQLKLLDKVVVCHGIKGSRVYQQYIHIRKSNNEKGKYTHTHTYIPRSLLSVSGSKGRPQTEGGRQHMFQIYAFMYCSSLNLRFSLESKHL